MSPQSAAWRDLGAVGLAAFVARLAYWRFVTPNWRPASDADQYVRLATSLRDGHGFSLVYPQLAMHATAFRPPLYPVVLLPAVSVTHGLWAARLTNVVLGSLVAVLAAVVARRIAGRTACIVAGLAVALYPPLLANDTITLSEPLALLLMLLLVLFVDDRRWLAAGVAGGLLLVTRPNVYLVALLVAALAYRCNRWRGLAAAAAPLLLLTVAWSIRNEIEVGTPRLVTSDGFTLAAIYAPAAQHAGDFVDPVLDHAYDADADLKLAQFDEATWDSKLTHLAITGVREHPGYVLTNVTRNAAKLLELTPSRNEPAETSDGRNLGFRRATLPTFYVVTVAGIAGFWRYRHDRRVQFLAFVVAQFAVLSLLTLAPPRLRAPCDVSACIGVGILAGACTRQLRSRTSTVEIEHDPPIALRTST